MAAIKEIPTFTSGLETRLNKTLGEDASKIIHYFSNRMDPPEMSRSVSEVQYRFHQQVHYRPRPSYSSLTTWDKGLFDPFADPVIVETRRVQLVITLIVNTDNKLTSYKFSMGAQM